MTKFHHMNAPRRDEEPERRGAAEWIALGMLSLLVFGAAIVLMMGWVVPDPNQPLSDIAQKLKSNLQQGIDHAPRIFPRLRLGDWPLTLLFPDRETRHKAENTVTTGRRPLIAIVVDDCGNDGRLTRQAIALPKPITLSFLPYPSDSYALSHRASLAGHEVIVHLPMQPIGRENPGPRALVIGLSPAEAKRRVDWALSRVRDYDGVNNHMGSRLTTSRKDLVPVMEELSDHGMFFLDSRTTADSVAETVARQSGMLAGARDIFLDDDESAVAVERQLALTEVHARTYGSAIAIGHPHPETLKALAVWARNVEARGFRLVSLRTAIELRQNPPRRKLSSLISSE
jgi:polysaccharide deacetylase 2 family uncharacterized protein YibQ